MQFLDIVVRQAHPGPQVPAYTALQQKVQDAEEYQREEGIRWPVLVDDLDGSVHQTYGGLSDPTYIINTEGRVAFYCHWTHAPTLHSALAELFAQSGCGVVHGGVDRRPHLLAAFADGWRGLERGLPQSAADMDAAVPGSTALLQATYALKPVLAPLALRATPLPPAVRTGLLVGAIGLGLAGLVWLARGRDHRREAYARG